MNFDLKKRLLAMAKLDEEVRSDLIRRGELFDGYHPELERVHNRNADDLSEIIREFGWPSDDLVGDEAAQAAWLVVQHAISKPDFLRRCLVLLKAEQARGAIPAKLVAALEDRILVYEGQAQIYGTQFDWDENGELSPNPIRDRPNVDSLRRSVGLSSLQEATDSIRKRSAQEGGKPPQDVNARKQEYLAWLRRAGWRA